MIYFFVGTIAELIKVFPIMKHLEEQGVPYQVVASGQNDLSKSELLGYLRTPVGIQLHEGPIRQNVTGLLGWFARTLISSFSKLRRAIPRRDRARSVWVVHGDTVSTLMGAILGRSLGLQVAHVEAGLRSFKYFSPFPEEICRCMVSYLATMHFCPNDWAVGNLKSHGGRKLSTGGNTLIDSLKFSQQITLDSTVISQIAGRRYFVFVVHRQENIYDEALCRDLIARIAKKISEGLTCVMIMHEPTRITFESNGVMRDLEKVEHLITVPRLRYLEFMKVLAGAEFLVTDGGSNQEESFYLGKPCLILRKATERTEGLGQNVVLSLGDPAIIEDFLLDPQKYARPALMPAESPSGVIAREIVAASNRS